MPMAGTSTTVNTSITRDNSSHAPGEPTTNCLTKSGSGSQNDQDAHPEYQDPHQRQEAAQAPGEPFLFDVRQQIGPASPAENSRVRGVALTQSAGRPSCFIEAEFVE